MPAINDIKVTPPENPIPIAPIDLNQPNSLDNTKQAFNPTSRALEADESNKTYES